MSKLTKRLKSFKRIARKHGYKVNDWKLTKSEPSDMRGFLAFATPRSWGIGKTEHVYGDGIKIEDVTGDAERVEFDAFSWHEALDRTHMVAETFDIFVGDHPVIESDADLNTAARHISALLGDLYQSIGTRSRKDTGDK